MAFYPGDIYYGFDAGANTKHRLLIVSREELNRGDRVITLLFTSAKLDERRNQPNYVFFPVGTQEGLNKDCIVQAESIAPTYLDEMDLDSGLLGHVDDVKLAEVLQAINYMLDNDG